MEQRLMEQDVLIRLGVASDGEAELLRAQAAPRLPFGFGAAPEAEVLHH